MFRNMKYHEARMYKTASELFQHELNFDLNSYLHSLKFPTLGLYKTRLVYDVEIRKVEFVPYIVRPIRTLKLVSSDSISYEYKYLDRTALDGLYQQRGDADEILITRNGLITDASYANVIFRLNDNWYTPQSCLLKGTMRQFLLDSGKIKKAVINVENYRQYESVKLINSMLGLDGNEISIASIQ